MTPLRAKMITDMQLHRLAPGTQALYLREVASLATFYGRSPAHLTADEIRAYLHHLLYFARDKMKLLSTSGKSEVVQSTSTRRFAHAQAGVEQGSCRSFALLALSPSASPRATEDGSRALA